MPYISNRSTYFREENMKAIVFEAVGKEPQLVDIDLALS